MRQACDHCLGQRMAGGRKSFISFPETFSPRKQKHLLKTLSVSRPCSVSASRRVRSAAGENKWLPARFPTISFKCEPARRFMIVRVLYSCKMLGGNYHNISSRKVPHDKMQTTQTTSLWQENCHKHRSFRAMKYTNTRVKTADAPEAYMRPAARPPQHKLKLDSVAGDCLTTQHIRQTTPDYTQQTREQR